MSCSELYGRLHMETFQPTTVSGLMNQLLMTSQINILVAGLVWAGLACLEQPLFGERDIQFFLPWPGKAWLHSIFLKDQWIKSGYSISPWTSGALSSNYPFIKCKLSHHACRSHLPGTLTKHSSIARDYTSFNWGIQLGILFTLSVDFCGKVVLASYRGVKQLWQSLTRTIGEI